MLKNHIIKKDKVWGVGFVFFLLRVVSNGSFNHYIFNQGYDCKNEAEFYIVKITKLVTNRYY
jgi:hypothetical protein